MDNAIYDNKHDYAQINEDHINGYASHILTKCTNCCNEWDHMIFPIYNGNEYP